MQPDRYFVEQILTCKELKEVLGYAQAHVDNCPVPVPEVEAILLRVGARLFALDAADGDSVYIFVPDGP